MPLHILEEIIFILSINFNTLRWILIFATLLLSLMEKKGEGKRGKRIQTFIEQQNNSYCFYTRSLYIPFTSCFRMCWIFQLSCPPWRSTIDQWQCVVLSCSVTLKTLWCDFLIESSRGRILPNKTHTRYASEKAMALHSSTLAWKIPWMEEPGGLQSLGLLRLRHDWAKQ